MKPIEFDEVSVREFCEACYLVPGPARSLERLLNEIQTMLARMDLAQRADWVATNRAECTVRNNGFRMSQAQQDRLERILEAGARSTLGKALKGSPVIEDCRLRHVIEANSKPPRGEVFDVF